MFIIIFLLIQSGTLQGAIKQMQDEATGKTSGDSKPDEFCSGERVHGAELHYHIILILLQLVLAFLERYLLVLLIY